MRIGVFIIGVLLALGLGKWSFSNDDADLPTVTLDEKIRGVCWVAGDSVVSDNFNHAVDANVKWISLTPFAWQEKHDSPDLHYDNSRSWWGERDEGILHTTRLAREKGMKVMLKPHIWLTRADGKWRSDIEMSTDQEWDTWFGHYESMILHYARLAAQGRMEALCIGTELLKPSTRYPERWESIIRKIREVYNGHLTYAANFHDEFEQITFWDKLDFIGVQAYFPLSNRESPDKNELIRSWKKHAATLRKVAGTYNRPVIFTEIGYKNCTDAAIEPWVWPSQVNAESVVISEDFQAICYEALFEVMWPMKWFGGLFIWKWFPGTHELDYDGVRAKMLERRKSWSARRNIPLGPNVEFTPQRKKAETVLSEWFGIEDLTEK